ncbi:MAG: TIGR03084 family protein [Acidobacteriota bacterium]|nr:TIGR03084 family protein [Acidobacteriota bacterium]
MPSAPSVPELLADLAEEQADLDALVDGIDEEQWATPTPAEGWTVRDQIGHLAFFDEMGRLAIEAPDGFSARAQAAMEAAAEGRDPMAEHLERGRAMTGAEVRAWWNTARAGFLAAAAGLSDDARVPWYGPPMSPRSFVSARLMETWAHGQDVADALGRSRTPTRRLAHVAQLGVRARPFSFAVRGLDAPAEDVRVELEGPSDETWTWGEEGAPGLVRGMALEFCLVVTQRRHLDDTALVVEGDSAREWMAIAQAFAGPPGAGRPPSG